MADEDEDEYEIVEERGGAVGGFIAGILLGALAGVAVGVLFAPAPGHTTRRRLRRQFDRLRDEAGDRIDQFGRKARRKLAEMRE